MDEIKVIKVTPTGKVVKVPHPTAPFRYPVILTLEDGREVETSEGARLKRQAVAKRAKRTEEGAVTNMKAVFNDGQLVMVSESFQFTGGGLAALAVD